MSNSLNKEGIFFIFRDRTTKFYKLNSSIRGLKHNGERPIEYRLNDPKSKADNKWVNDLEHVLSPMERNSER